MHGTGGARRAEDYARKTVRRTTAAERGDAYNQAVAACLGGKGCTVTRAAQ
jgi:hypothetical protein